MANGGGIVRRPAVPRPIRIRRSVMSLPANDPILTFYGKAMQAMLAKPISESTSWRFQAAIHDYVAADDPLAKPGESFPPDTGTYWAQCEHRNWFFLPWHRMYLHHFEMIVLAEVMKQGGPEDWALPYWNYSAPGAQLLPPAFQQGSSTGLFIPQRDPNANSGQPFLTLGPGNDALRGGDTDITCLQEPQYTATAPGGSNGFGGLKPVLPALKNHGGGAGEGRVESLPHDSMHGAISGNDFLPDGSLKPLNQRGWMGNFTRAPLDPIFWVHHCNIDRLWEVWIKAGHTNPTSADWLTNVTWHFRTATGADKEMKVSDVLDTRAAPLSYMYDDTKNPFGP